MNDSEIIKVISDEDNVRIKMRLKKFGNQVSKSF